LYSAISPFSEQQVLSSIKFMIISLKISLCVLSWHQRKTGEKTETKKNLIFSVSARLCTFPTQ
jgi:hypothetical protein